LPQTLLIHKKKQDRSCFAWLKDKLHFLPFSGTRRFGTQFVGPIGGRVKAKVALRVGRGLQRPSLRALKDYRGSRDGVIRGVPDKPLDCRK
jgi:hypothetical protein